MAEALEKARERALACHCSVFLWRNGRRMAEIPSNGAGPATPSRELLEKLAGAGWYVVGVSDEVDSTAPGSPLFPPQADRIESR
nr:hypothetical protein [uncultured Brevundimonas sp.]